MEPTPQAELLEASQEMRARLEQAYADLYALLERLEGPERGSTPAQFINIVRQQLAAAEQALAAVDAELERA